ncbi:MAG: hypothetical protein K6B69_08145 [Lachnospiraceae bacterium]|nr:hypothetical protein [Lachnospiraceae bacterium]
MEYPVIDYKNSHYDKKAYSTLLSISAVSGLMALLFVFILSKGADEPILRPVALLFGVASIGLLLLAVMWARNAYMTRTYGKDYTALVLGDVDNKELDFDNTQGEKTVKLLIRTNKGYRIILHKLGLEDSESYIKNKQAVKIRYFKKKYMIAENDRR